MNKTVFEKALETLPLRQRYILTRRNRLRLRYVALPLCALMLLGSVMLGGASDAPQPVEVAQNGAEDVDGLLSAMQRRLKRYETGSTEVAAAEPVTIASIIRPRPQPRNETIKIDKGDTLAGLLQKAGISGGESYKAVLALQKYLDPRSIRPGQTIKVHLDPADDTGSRYDFAKLSMALDPLKTVSLEKKGEGEFVAALEEKEAVKKLYARRADIELSLYGSGLKAGIPASVLAEAIRVYSWDIDFQRDIRRGDAVEVMYEQFETEEGATIRGGDILYARLRVNGSNIPIYRYKMKNGDVDYFTADGTSIRKALLSTPIDGARLSSGFGMRKHPVLGYNKMHKGVDFAAPTGTPIYAAGDGTIEYASKYSSYGNYVRIRHNSSIKTAYAHMSRFGKGIKPGTRVKQGQIIGYVGTTGRSTGPHLHYEVMMAGTPVNPRSVKLPQGEALKGTELASFKAHIRDLDRRYAGLIGEEQYASIATGRSASRLR